MKKSILILQNKILHFRKGFYNELSKSYNITVIHSGNKSVLDTDSYNEIIVKQYNIFGFILQSKILKEVLNSKYYKIIVMADLHFINNILTYFIVSNKRFIWWGPWLTNKIIIDHLKLFFSRKSTTIFYSQDELNRFKSKEIDGKRLFLANNTFDVGTRYKCYKHVIKDSILFVGSFNKRKQLDVLIMAFHNSLNRIPNHINLVLIGDGQELIVIKNLVSNLKIEHRVLFKGALNDNKELIKFYKRSIVSVSFGQAGLSVLQAMGFGVPFVTKRNAISGGEKTNIKHGINGYFAEDKLESLENILQMICNDQIKARELGKNAYEYYSEKCTVGNMANGFIKAIESNYK